MILGNDISSFQGDVDFDTYKSNSNLIIVKASEGTGFVDPKLSRNQSEARRVGLPLGYYHFARPDLGNDPAHEADWFLKVVGPLNVGEVLCLDYEVTYNDPVTWCLNFLERVKFMTNGVKALIYLNQAVCQQFDWSPVISQNYGLWIAAYTYDPNKNDFNGGKWQTSVMQQWTDNQIVPGISGVIDGDVFFGDVNTFKKYGYQPPVVIPPQPPSVPPRPPTVPPSVPPAPPTTTPTIPPVNTPTGDIYKPYLISIKGVVNNGYFFWKLFSDTRKIKDIITKSGA